MYAVIRTGGKQYRVEPGVEFLVEKLDTPAGETVELTDILAFSDDSSFSVGQPRLPVTAVCRVLKQELGPKLRTVKYRRRHNYKKTYGHRQMYTRLVVEQFDRKGN